MDVKGCVVLITGGDDAYGKAFADGMAAAGAAKIYAGARNPASIDGKLVIPIRLDVTDPAEVAAAAAQCGDVTVLINNAGVATMSPLIGAATMDGARAEMEVNYFGVLAMCRAFAPVLRRNGGGAIVNIVSVASFITGDWLWSYSASKMAAFGLTLGVRIELQAQGTLVMSAHMGFIDTDSNRIQAKKITPTHLVEKTLAALAAEEEEVLPDARSLHILAALLQNPKLLEGDADRAWVTESPPSGFN